ncbi:MAG: hypothetical protein LBU67_01525 [Oscillospiraceae bacterium]|jgi:hypothetical protein|nr:hypothetical protein [Oscillospiraceae bacterium]
MHRLLDTLGSGNWDGLAWGGVALLLAGAAVGFGADGLCKLLHPGKPQRAAVYRLAGLGAAIIGALWALGAG